MAGLIDVLRSYIAHIGRGDVYRLLRRERLNRKENFACREAESKTQDIQDLSPGYLHIDIKNLPNMDKIRRYLFVAIDRNT